MRIAALYDVHGNLPALEAVLEEVHRERVDQIVVGGDVVPGPMPRETIDLLVESAVPVRFIHGNGDREVLALMSGLETEWYRTAPEQWKAPVAWSAQQLEPRHQQTMAAWPLTCRIDHSEAGPILFCHATPQNDTDCFTRLTSDDRLVRLLGDVDARLVVCGHTHMQFDRSVNGIRVVNAGSVGMPFGGVGAYWLLLGPAVQLRHTSYDLADAARRIRATGYPDADEFVARNVLNPPSADDMLELFGRAESV
jgi:predicted phosphodiesterase